MKRSLIMAILYACSGMASATDITLLTGLQFDNDFTIASINTDTDTEEFTNTGDAGDDITLDDTVSFSLAVDFVFNRQSDLRVGFYLSHEQTQFDANAGLVNRDLDITHAHFTAMSYYPRGRFEPFVMAGLGLGHFSPGDSALKSESQFSGQIGTGINYRVTDAFLVRADIRWIATFFDSSAAVFCDGGCLIALKSSNFNQAQANLGLMYRF